MAIWPGGRELAEFRLFMLCWGEQWIAGAIRISLTISSEMALLLPPAPAGRLLCAPLYRRISLLPDVPSLSEVMR